MAPPAAIRAAIKMLAMRVDRAERMADRVFVLSLCFVSNAAGS